MENKILQTWKHTLLYGPIHGRVWKQGFFISIFKFVFYAAYDPSYREIEARALKTGFPLTYTNRYKLGNFVFKFQPKWKI